MYWRLPDDAEYLVATVGMEHVPGHLSFQKGEKLRPIPPASDV